MKKADNNMYEPLGELARLIGSPAFYTAMMNIATSIVESEMNIIMLYSHRSAPIYINCETVPEPVVEMYNSGYYRFDPFYHYWRERGIPAVLSAREASPSKELTRNHFLTFLPSAGINDEIGILLPTIGNSAVGLFLERHNSFTEAEKEKIREIFPLFLGLHMAHQKLSLSADTEQHKQTHHFHMANHAYKIYDQSGVALFENEDWHNKKAESNQLDENAKLLLSQEKQQSLTMPAGELYIDKLADDFPFAPGGWICSLHHEEKALPPISFNEAMNDFLSGLLTPRERQIIELILAGYPSSKIAEKLAISIGNVKNHRKRIYVKMDITTEREIFLQFLEHLSTT
ncbi:response regulator transcription factor [Dasania marina]|uniref:response regulator transcription factor n=1 Tax=Dasania marina TaxID=471499 RepID=UPI001969F2F2|nr:helix-turn-helix transcriptional regulator [Dasania marina]